jgi:hypothetical protein
MLTAMVGSAEIGPDGEVFFNRPLGDQRFLEPNSGLYWQISGRGTRISLALAVGPQPQGARRSLRRRSRMSMTATSSPASRCASWNDRSSCPAARRSWWFTVAPAAPNLDAQIRTSAHPALQLRDAGAGACS